MHTVELTPNATPRTYAELRRAVEAVLVRDQHAVDVAQITLYWTTGDLIHGHVELHKERGEFYDQQVVARLARDLRKGPRLLYRCLEFRRAYDFQLLSARTNLLWAHYRVLMQIEDRAQRDALERAADEQKWKSRLLEERARPLLLAQQDEAPSAASAPTASRLLTPKRGTPGIYRLVPGAETLAIDYGFMSFDELAPEQAAKFSAGDLIRFDAAGRIVPAEDARPADLFTYRAECLRVIDGDTIWFRPYVRPRRFLKQKVRLRGIDCPEIDSPQGRAAKRFTENLLARAESIVITTTTPDKYNRYLADVHAATDSGGEIFLNNALLENGHARRADSYALEEWEKGSGGVPA